MSQSRAEAWKANGVPTSRALTSGVSLLLREGSEVEGLITILSVSYVLGTEQFSHLSLTTL